MTLFTGYRQQLPKKPRPDMMPEYMVSRIMMIGTAVAPPTRSGGSDCFCATNIATFSANTLRQPIILQIISYH